MVPAPLYTLSLPAPVMRRTPSAEPPCARFGGGGVFSTCVYGRFGQRLRQPHPLRLMETTGPGPPWVHRGVAQLRCPRMMSGAVCGVCKSQVTNFHGCLGGSVRGVGSWCKMAVVSSSMVSFRNAAYNMFFKRTTTTLGFVLGPPTCARPGALSQACVTCKPSQVHGMQKS